MRYAIMSGWCVAFIPATSRELKASSPFFMSSSGCVVRVVRSEIVEFKYFPLFSYLFPTSVMAKLVCHSF
jgi:hypothetical protein